MPDTKQSMSQKIKAAMASRGMTQADICAATGMKPTLLARMLRDNDHNYTVKTLSRIAAALDTDLSIEFDSVPADTGSITATGGLVNLKITRPVPVSALAG